MEIRERSLTDLQIDLDSSGRWVALLLGLGNLPTPGLQPPTVERIRIALPIEHARQVVDQISSALNYRAKFVPPTDSTH